MFNTNDTVFWNDPDCGYSSDIYTIQSTSEESSWINEGTEVPNHELVRLGKKIKDSSEVDVGLTVFFYDKEDLPNSGEVLIEDIISPDLVVVSSEERIALFELEVTSLYKLGA